MIFRKNKKLPYDIKICVSGAAETSHCGPNAYKLAIKIGEEIVRQGAKLITGATTGFPFWSAEGAKKAKGVSIGISPASNEAEHVNTYGLPTDFQDLIVYTGFGYSGRDLILVRSCDAVIFGCGRIGTINEFTIGFEDGKVLGVLEGDWATDEVIKNIVAKGNRPNSKIVYDKDPKKLVQKVIAMVLEEKKKTPRTYMDTQKDTKTCGVDPIL